MSLPPLTIIPAGAGSGKTYTIQTRLATWVRERKISPDKIVAVTFTEAAASELRDRIRAELVRQGRLEDALGLDRAYISTIHSFGLRILTEFAFDAGYNPLPRLLTEDEQGVLIRLALAATDKAEAIMGDLNRFGYAWDFSSGKGAEDKFRERVLQVIRRLRTLGPAAVNPQLAQWSADLVRQHYGPVEDAEKLAAALQKAVTDLLQQFPEDLSVVASTSGVARRLAEDHRQLRRACHAEELRQNWGLWNRLRTLQQSTPHNALPEAYDQLTEAVTAAAEGLLRHPGPLEEALLHGSALYGAAQDSLTRFANGKADRGLVDYTDMLALALEILERNPAVLDTLQERVDCLVIDEFQDTNPLQFALLWSLARAGIPTLIVGDLKQAIMGFQDADSRLLAELQKQNSAAVTPLTSNWRSHPGLLDWINQLGAGLFGADYTPLQAKADFPTALGPLELVEFSARSRNDLRAEHTVARIKVLLDDPETRVWDKELKKARPIRGGDIAILCPTNKRLELYAEALRQLGVRVRMEAGGWFESRIVQIAWHALSYVADPLDRHAALYLGVTELGTETLPSAFGTLIREEELRDPLLAKLKPLRAACDEQLPASLLAETIAALNLYGLIADWPDGEQARANLLRFEEEAREFAAANRDALAASGFYGSDVKTFLAWIKDRAERENGQPDPRVRDEDAVQLMTWHSSKGREWPVVAVCAADSDIKCLLPDVRVNYRDFSDLDKILDNARLDFYPEFVAPEKTELFRQQLWPEAIDSARRLLYVALTRAREKVILEWPVYLDNGRERKSFSYFEQLLQDTGLKVDGNRIVTGGKAFDCRIIQVGKDRHPLFEAAGTGTTHSLPVWGRRAIRPQPLPEGLIPETIRPSGLGLELEVSAADLDVAGYADCLNIDFDLPANERGTVLHRCYEVMDGRHDLETIRMAVRHPFSPEEFNLLQKRVIAFNDWLKAHFQPVSLQYELPVLALNRQGSVVTGFIDLLVETEDGFWIIDHKSDQIEDRVARFAEHLPQLLCYRQALATIYPDKEVLGVCLNWITYGETMSLRLGEDQGG
ncbi:UvrD-helicase domain-containing protein [Geothermobacter hydrogeniphilus]|uniref:DNA 3'-5' helicase n=1 Tax=Geothermobacter hydrogeniphilus TaxID=1969733 RepID=A0A1X0XSK1_9BACT|nr:UvrD-helicase domain-containing protein [Geothermobacter hydrogeniphilus]ORJ55892.1 hypothetical protein B5V00_14630 [Geothermobacter hydrogeniphilus]